MAKIIKSVAIQIMVTKDYDGEVQISESADITISPEGYPEFETRKGIAIALTAPQKTAILNHVKSVVLPQAEVAK